MHIWDIQGTSKNSPFGLGANLTPYKYAMKKPQYTKYSVFFITFHRSPYSAPSHKKEFLEVAYS